MIVNDVLILTAKYLDDSELYAAAIKSNKTSSDIALLDPYIEILGMVQTQVATEHIPLVFKENIKVDSTSFSVDNLTNKFYKIIKVLKNGKKQNYYLLGNNLILPAGEYEIWYQYLPQDLLFSESNVETFGGKLNARTYALGVAGEYCLIKGMYNTAEAFETRFLSSLKAIKNYRPHKTMPKRRWL